MIYKRKITQKFSTKKITALNVSKAAIFYELNYNPKKLASTVNNGVAVIV